MHLALNESQYGSFEITSLNNFWFQAATLSVRTDGGTAIPNYHYVSSGATRSLEKGYGLCTGSAEACAIQLDVEILWRNVKPDDFLTIDLEVTYGQGNELLRVVIPNAVQLWGLPKNSNSCPRGFSTEGLTSARWKARGMRR